MTSRISSLLAPLRAIKTATVVASALIIYGILFIVIERVRKDKTPVITSVHDIKPAQAICIGVFQMLAIIPGTSRSGSTILGSMMLGLSRGAAAEFSFLMSAPPIAGAVLLHIAEIFSASNASGVVELPWGHCLFGAAIAALVGYFSLKLLVESLKRKYFWLFGPYCLSAGLLILLLIAN